jgi:hypothetical protein
MDYDLKSRERQYKEDLIFLYTEVKNLFIESEEILPRMRMFATPTLEHRDALEHIMRYMNMTKDGNVSYDAVKQLESAFGHEIRAYFDTADYLTVSIRDSISNSLDKIPNRKIKKNWESYSEVKKDVLGISLEIAEIRKQKHGNMEIVRKYQPLVNKVLEYYKKFINDIEPNLRK